MKSLSKTIEDISKNGKNHLEILEQKNKITKMKTHWMDSVADRYYKEKKK